MELPQPPQDQELRNIIDKLAQFVARNGPEFEQMTKNKQKDNPKFGFLFGGEHFNYYQYKVTTEQAILKHKGRNRTNSADLNAGNTQILLQGGAAGTGNSNVGVVMPGSGGSVVGVTQGPNVSTSSPIATNLQPQSGAAGGPPAHHHVGAWMVAPRQVTLAPPPPPPPPPPPALTEALTLQQQALHDQIRQSEQNLAAQHQVLMQQQQSQIEETLRKAQEDQLARLAEEGGVRFAELDTILQPIIDSCTKDSISAGKGWIFARSSSPTCNRVVALYLLKKVIGPGAPFTQKLHIIYLVNDVLHHCVRKNAEDLKKALEGVVVPMFCNATLGVGEEQQSKLNKLLTLWESKSNYFEPSVIERLKHPSQSWSEYQASLITEHAAALTPVTTAVQRTYEGYQAQHQAFVRHATQQIQQLEQQKQQMEQQAAVAAAAAAAAAAAVVSVGVAGDASGVQGAHMQPHLASDIPGQQPPPGQQGQGNAELSFNLPPPGYAPSGFPPGLELPDLSKPPPGFPAGPGAAQPPAPLTPEPSLDDLLPSVPYYELPAGLMVPLIKLEDGEYKPLNPMDIRLPPPAPPSERLLAAVEAFYGPPSHDRPRDSEGWEKLGLYEYYRAKNAARRKKEDDIRDGIRTVSRSPSPIVRARSRSKTPPPRKRYRSKSRSKSPQSDAELTLELGKTSSSPPSVIPNSNAINSSGMSLPLLPRPGKGSQGPLLTAAEAAAVAAKTSSSPNKRNSSGSVTSPEQTGALSSNARHRKKGSDVGPGRSRSRSRSLSPPTSATIPGGGGKKSPERSPTPPSFLGSTYGGKGPERVLDESNKGHQMLRKMGWGGAGLGAKEQGIETPISGGEVRDRTDQYKGLGVNLNDPYENFRKSKGQAFINRMKARAEEWL